MLAFPVVQGLILSSLAVAGDTPTVSKRPNSKARNSTLGSPGTMKACVLWPPNLGSVWLLMFEGVVVLGFGACGCQCNVLCGFRWATSRAVGLRLNVGTLELARFSMEQDVPACV